MRHVRLGSVSRWRAALRVARRDAWQHRVRSLLVIALVGLPVLVLSTIAVLYRTYQVAPTEQISRIIGHADAWLTWYGASGIQQDPDAPFDGGIGFSERGSARPAPSVAAVAAQLPGGSRVIQYRSSYFGWSYYTKTGIANANMVGVDYADPIAAGLVDQVSGRAPRTDAEAAVTSHLSETSGLGIGDTLRLTDPLRTFTIVGIVRQRLEIRDETIFTLPAATPLQKQPDGGFVERGQVGWLASTPRAISWADVLHLDTAGFVTLSRHVFLNPPPKSQQVFNGESSSAPISAQTITTATLVGGMALLEVVLLAGPAFAVSARRRQRDLGLLSAIGGDRRDLRRTVLADAVVLGLAAGVIATVLGVGAAAAAEPLLEDYLNHLPGAFDVPLLQLAGLVLLSMVTALLAALAPAHRASRTDVVAALAGRRGTVRSSRRWPMIGVLLGLGGVALSSGALSTMTATTIVVGVALVEVGIICCTPMLIGAVAHVARWLPLSARIALRDAGRNRTSAAPAVAAVMAAVIGAVAMSIAATSSRADAQSHYLAALPQRDTYVSLGFHHASETAVLAAIRSAAPTARPVVLHSASSLCSQTASSTCVQIAVAGSGQPEFSLPALVIDDGTGLDALLGRHVPAASAALAAGRAVITSSTSHPATSRLIITKVSSGPSKGPAARTVPIASATVPLHYAAPQVIVPPAMATRLGLVPTAAGVLVPSAHPFTAAQQQKLALGLAAAGHALDTTYEQGFTDASAWVPFALVGAAAFVALFAALIATALANIDSRPDLVTLGAVGASPRTRRVLSMARAAVIAGLGALIGTIAGVLPASAWVRSINASVVLPWPALGLAVLGIPAAAALLAGLFTRTRALR